MVSAFNYSLHAVFVGRYVSYTGIVRIDMHILRDKLHIFSRPGEIDIIESFTLCIKIDPHETAAVRPCTDKLHIISCSLNFSCKRYQRTDRRIR